MSRVFLFKYISASLCAFSGLALHADASMESLLEMPEFHTPLQNPMDESTPALVAPIIMEPSSPKKAMEKPEIDVNPFTGKVKGRKVRMRVHPDLESRIVKELSKNELVTVIGEKGDFWAVQAPHSTKAYVFRSFVLDNVVEGTRVNVRLEPSMDAPIIAHLNSGDKIEDAIISGENPKWLEIIPPESTRFYIAKEYIDYAGGPEVKAQMDRKQASAEQLLESSSLLSKTELRKNFEDMDFDRIVKGYNTVIQDFTEFPELVEQAKDALAAFQEAYLMKRISHLESHPAEALAEQKRAPLDESVFALTDKMKSWEPIEEALYLTWSTIHDNKSQQEFYDEQKLACLEISGIVEPYAAPVKSKPGDYILRDKDVPVGYIYSTIVNLQSLVGKQVKAVVSPRPNNNFAFPAYYVLAVE